MTGKTDWTHFSGNVAFMTELSKRLTEHIKGTGNRKQVIEGLGVTTQTVGRWLTGKDIPKFYYLMWIAHRFDLDAGQLVELAKRARAKSKDREKVGREDFDALWKSFPWKAGDEGRTHSRINPDLHGMLNVILESPDWAPDITGNIWSIYNSVKSGLPRPVPSRQSPETTHKVRGERQEKNPRAG